MATQHTHDAESLKARSNVSTTNIATLVPHCCCATMLPDRDGSKTRVHADSWVSRGTIRAGMLQQQPCMKKPSAVLQCHLQCVQYPQCLVLVTFWSLRLLKPELKSSPSERTSHITAVRENTRARGKCHGAVQVQWMHNDTNVKRDRH